MLRPDGTLLQQPGYDPATGLYLASKVPLDPVPEEPTAGRSLPPATSCWPRSSATSRGSAEADKANYIGLLVTPILRSYLRTLIPFGVVTSTMPGSGKTILTCGLGMLYGQRVLTWTHSDEELRKAITSVLADPVGTIIFDNLAEGTVIDSPVLARLITDRTWADRLLGGNKTAAFANDRVWTATGNNLRLGGDMRTRSVLVGLNPDMPRPEERTGFKIPDLDQWILAPANQRQVLWHLLVLVADWTRAGAPRQAGPDHAPVHPVGRGGRRVPGPPRHRRVPGQRGDRPRHRRGRGRLDGVLRPVAQDPRRQVADQQRAAPVGRHPAQARPTRGTGWFVTDARGRFPSPKSLGRLLTGQINRYRGSYVLRSEQDKHSKIRTWRVEEWSG